MSLEGLRRTLRRIKSQYGGEGGYSKEDYVKGVHAAADADGLDRHGAHTYSLGPRPNDRASHPDERPSE